MLISKRELLDETGISYGQLYRWKREGLIPEEWFIKQSAYTGQETFFPKELIIKRIKAIHDLKDNYTLEEVAKLLSPEVPSKGFAFDDLESINEISKEILYALRGDIDEDNVLYIHVLMLIIITALKEEFNLYTSQVVELYEGIRPYIKNVKSTNYIYKLFEVDKKYYSILYRDESNFYVDNRFLPIKSIRMEDISNEFKIKHKTQFDYFMTESGENKKVRLNEKDKMSDVEIEIINEKEKYEQSFHESSEKNERQRQEERQEERQKERQKERQEERQEERQNERQEEPHKESQKDNKLDDSETIKISLDDIEVISNKNGSKIYGSNKSGSYKNSNQSDSKNKQENKKINEDDKIILKFNNWEVRL